MLMREDLGVLVLGAREAIYALDMSNISITKAEVRRCKVYAELLQNTHWCCCVAYFV